MNSKLDEVWPAVCAILEPMFTRDVFDRWIRAICPVALDGGILRLSVPNDFYVWWLEENYLPLIRKALTTVTGEELRIELAANPNPSPPVPAATPEPKAAPARAVRKSSRFLSALNPHFCFGTFVVGASNMFAHTASMSVAQAPGKAYNPLLIYGGPSLGKTHLMHAIGHHVAQTHALSNVCYISTEAFLNEYIVAMDQKRFGDFRTKFRSMDLLLIDDIQFLAGKDRLQEEFFYTFNELHNAHKQIVMTCDRAPSEVTGLEQRLVSRFEWGVITQIESPDFETRVAILKKKAEHFTVPLPEKVILTIAERIRSDVRALEGALKSVASYASLHGRALSDDDLENVLRHAMTRQERQAPSFESIQKAVADYYDLRLADLTGRRRMASVAHPRQIAMFLSRTLTNQSLPVIGEAFGRNHATVLHAFRQIERRMKTDSSLRQTVSAIRSKLGTL